MPWRKYQVGTSSYRYGQNGQERDKELNENIYTAEYWEYDARLVRRWNVDPKPNIAISPYNCFAGNPIWFSDILGDSIPVITAGSGGAGTAYDLHKDAGTFLRGANALAKRINANATQINSGNTFVQLLQNATKTDGSVSSFISYAHAGGNGMYYNNNEGFYTVNSAVQGQASNVKLLGDKIDNGSIKFSKNAVGILAGCNTYACQYDAHGVMKDYNGILLAESMASTLRIPMIASNNKVNIIEKDGTLKTDGNFYMITPVLKTVNYTWTEKISHKFLGVTYKTETIEHKGSYTMVEKLEAKKLGKIIDPKNYMQ